jgi:hypothetical protein
MIDFQNFRETVGKDENGNLDDSSFGTFVMNVCQNDV